MEVAVVVGLNWGDEGKGRVVDYLAQSHDVVVRFQGGNNAGHTVVNERGLFKLSMLPSGVFNPNVVNILGPGTVVNVEALGKELTDLAQRGIDPIRLMVSERALLVFPFHQAEDAWEDERRTAAAMTPFGSTRRGIAPIYGDRYLKRGIQVGDLRHPEYLRERLRELVEYKNLVASRIYGKTEKVSFEAMLDWATSHGKRVLPMIADTSTWLAEAAASGKRILFEAQLGALRDVIHGIYPYTTSSNTLAAYYPVGGGLFRHGQVRVLGVTKAFSSAVGEGPFITEMTGPAADEFREQTGEFGAATGRPRRVGPFDAVATRYGAALQEPTEVVLTKLDNLSGRGALRICTHYRYRGQLLDAFPINAVLDECEAVYEEVPGWDEDITGARRFGDLPRTAQAYVLRLEELIRKPIRWVSVGPERNAIIDRSRD